MRGDKKLIPRFEAAVRDLRRKGIAWRVREMDAKNIPGARAERCLIFDSDGIVRRVWSFPHGWAEMDDDGIWSLLDSKLPAPLDRPRKERRSNANGDPTNVVTATRTAASTHALVTALGDSDAEAIQVSAEDTATTRVRQSRTGMQSAVMDYTASLRSNGVPPERAIVLVKSAVAEGLEQAPECSDYTSRALIDDAVNWCIDAYYA